MSRKLSPDAAPTCLIIGMAGVGKSTLVEELQRRQRLAFDADTVPNLGAWYDSNGKRQQYQPDREWRKQHKFLWDISLLAGVIVGRPQDQPLYIAGTSSNVFDAARMFDQTVVLEADVDTIFTRRTLSSRRTPYPFDTTPADLPALETNIQLLQKSIRELGMIAVDAWYPVGHIADEVIGIVEGLA